MNKGSLFMTMLGLFPVAKWDGVDKTIVERFAKGAGRAPWKPFFDTSSGDLALFVFLVAGIAGGFVLGYYYRKLFGERAS